MAAPLSQRLREETKDAHTRAERSPFMQALFRGQLERGAYARFMTDLHALYVAMEGALDRVGAHPALAPVNHPELRRVPELERDLAFFHGADWREKTRCSDVARDYAAHIAALEKSDPALLVAHLYTRYLGDLSGGQVLKRIATKNFALAGEDGVAFYVFPGIPDADAFKNAYRRALDELPLDAATADRVVEEAKAAFDWNGRMADANLSTAPL